MSNKLKVDLNDVIECIEFEGELLQHYYNKNTGVIMYIEDSSTASYKADDIHKSYSSLVFITLDITPLIPTNLGLFIMFFIE